MDNYLIEDNDSNGVSISQERRLKIDNNRITNNKGHGITVLQIPDEVNVLQSSELIITSNIVSKNGETGIWISALVDENNKTIVEKPLAENVLISNNTVIDNKWNGIGCQSRFSTIQSNLVSRNGFEKKHQGILINAHGVTTSGNTVTKNKGVGIDLGDCKRVVCSNNHVEENGIFGIEVNGCEATSVIGNILVNNCQVTLDVRPGETQAPCVGILVHGDTDELHFGESFDIIVTNNIIRKGFEDNQEYGIRIAAKSKRVNISHNIFPHSGLKQDIIIEEGEDVKKETFIIVNNIDRTI